MPPHCGGGARCLVILVKRRSQDRQSSFTRLPPSAPKNNKSKSNLPSYSIDTPGVTAAVTRMMRHRNCAERSYESIQNDTTNFLLGHRGLKMSTGTYIGNGFTPQDTVQLCRLPQRVFVTKGFVYEFCNLLFCTSSLGGGQYRIRPYHTLITLIGNPCCVAGILALLTATH